MPYPVHNFRDIRVALAGCRDRGVYPASFGRRPASAESRYIPHWRAAVSIQSLAGSVAAACQCHPADTNLRETCEPDRALARPARQLLVDGGQRWAERLVEHDVCQGVQRCWIAIDNYQPRPAVPGHRLRRLPANVETRQAARADGGCAAGPSVPRRNCGAGSGLRRRTLDGAGSDRPGRPRPGDQRRTDGALRLAGWRRLRCALARQPSQFLRRTPAATKVKARHPLLTYETLLRD